MKSGMSADMKARASLVLNCFFELGRNCCWKAEHAILFFPIFLFYFIFFAGKDSDVPYEINRPNTIQRCFQYATFSHDVFNLGQYSHLPVCSHHQFPLSQVSTNVKCTLTSRGLTSLLGEAKAVHHYGQRVPHVIVPRGKNVNITLDISPDMGLVHHIIEQRMVMRATFQVIINELVIILDPCVPINEEVFIIFDGARPHLNIIVPLEFQDRFHVVMLPRSSHIAHFSTPSSKPIAV